VEEQEDIYGDGLGVDPESIPPKYMTIMASPLPPLSLHCPNKVSNKSRIANETPF